MLQHKHSEADTTARLNMTREAGGKGVARPLPLCSSCAASLRDGDAATPLGTHDDPAAAAAATIAPAKLAGGMNPVESGLDTARRWRAEKVRLM